MAKAQLTGDRIDLYFGDWHGATPRTIRGSLEERDILTPGDAENPPKKGALLRYVNSYTYATLAPGQSAAPPGCRGSRKSTLSPLAREQQLPVVKAWTCIATLPF
jgi:hypothetical protein